MASLYQNPAMDRLRRARAQEQEEHEAWRHVNFEAPLPSSYWEEGSHVDPCADRVQRLRDYLYLFNGDPVSPGWLSEDDSVVFKNYFSDVSLLYADFMMSSPPIFWLGEQLLVDTDLLPEQSLRSLTTALERIVLDQIRYGTALANVVEGKVEVLSPVYWYPTGGEDDVVIGPSLDPDAFMTMLHFEPDGATTAKQFEVGKHPSGADDPSTLGQFIGTVDEVNDQIGDAAVWDVIEELTEGRRVTLTPCPRDPTDGEWGWRLFEPLAPLVFEYSKRMSKRSKSLDRHGTPILYAVPRDNDVDTVMPSLSGQEELQQVRFADLDAGLSAWRGQKVAFLPREVQDLVYLHFDGSFEVIENELNEIRRDIVSTTRLPASLLGIEEMKLGSGVALRVAHSQTYLAMANLQATLIPKIKRMLLLLAASDGASADSLREFSDQLSIDWENPLVFIEAQELPTQTDDGTEMEDELPEDADGTPMPGKDTDPEEDMLANLVSRAAEAREKRRHGQADWRGNS